MKNQLRILIVILLICSFNSYCRQAKFLILKDKKTQAHKGLIFISNTKYENERSFEEAWNIFHDNVFQFRKLLNIAKDLKLPILLVIPDNIDNISTLSNDAPWIEGARVALTWASVFFRFKELGNVDVRV